MARKCMYDTFHTTLNVSNVMEREEQKMFHLEKYRIALENRKVSKATSKYIHKKILHNTIQWIHTITSKIVNS